MRLVVTLRNIYSPATLGFGAVLVNVTSRAWTTTLPFIIRVVELAENLNIFTIWIVILPASRAARAAIQPHRRLDEASRAKQAEGY